MSLLYINACVRKDSRTNSLAKYLLSKYNSQIEELNLNDENICGLNRTTLENRDKLINNKKYNNSIFNYAKQFANADIIVISAPFWDLSFPTILKAYFEAINIVGITFKYNEQGIPESLCKAKKLIYITTAGGPILNDEYGFGYVKALSNIFYGIQDIKYFKAQCLDVIGNDPSKILEEAKQEIYKQMITDKDFRFN